jgi:hypothetical protein
LSISVASGMICSSAKPTGRFANHPRALGQAEIEIRGGAHLRLSLLQKAGGDFHAWLTRPRRLEKLKLHGIKDKENL